MTPWTEAHPEWPDGLRNVHSRVVAGDLGTAERLLAAVGSAGDQLWPRDRWPPMELDSGLSLGSRGGHGSVRYDVAACDARSVLFTFSPESGLEGEHELRVEPASPGHVLWTHRLDLRRGTPTPSLRLVLTLHDALIEELLDHAAARQAGRQPTPPRHSPRTDLARRALRVIDQRREVRVPGWRRVIGSGAAATLAGVGVLHVLWSTGSTWPAPSRAALADSVIGSGTLPPASACLAVGVGLGAAALATADRTRPVGARGALPFAVSDLTVRTTAAGLLARAAMGLGTSALGLGGTPSYRRWDVSVYTPLCLGLAAALAATVSRTPAR